MFRRKTESESSEPTEAAATEGLPAPGAWQSAALPESPLPAAGNGGGDAPPPALVAAKPEVAAPEAGVSFVQYQGPKDTKTKRQPKAVPAVVVSVAADGTCTLKLLDRTNSPRVEGVPYSAVRTDEARWFWPA